MVLNYFHSTEGPKHRKEGLFVRGNDTQSYFEPIENTIDNKTYSLNEKVSLFRMPGLLPVYGPLYLFFPKSVARQLFVLLQIIGDALLACLVFILLFKTIGASPFFSFLGWGLYIVSTFVSSYNHYGLPETFATLTLTCFLIFLIRFFTDYKLKSALLSGYFLCWFTFLKPIGIVFYIVIGFIFLILLLKREQAYTKKNLFIAGLIFILPFLIFDGIWTIRNYSIRHKVIPLSSVLDNSDARTYLKKFFKTTGLSFQSFSGRDHMTWFSPRSDKPNDEAFFNSDPFPKWMYTSEYNFDSLKVLRSMYWQVFNNDSVVSNKQSEINFKNKIDDYIGAFKKEKAFHYYITVKAIAFRDFLFVKTTYNLPFSGNTTLQKTSRGAYFLFYYLVILSFILFSVLVLLRRFREGKAVILILTICWSFIFAHILLGTIENRYLVPVYPMMLILSVICWKNLLDKIQEKRSSQIS